eukprot:1374005-Amorphochlora_amoeboformis.AAC.1
MKETVRNREREKEERKERWKTTEREREREREEREEKVKDTVKERKIVRDCEQELRDITGSVAIYLRMFLAAFVNSKTRQILSAHCPALILNLCNLHPD